MATGYLIKIGVYIHGLALGGSFIKKQLYTFHIGFDSQRIASIVVIVVSHIDYENATSLIKKTTINGGLVEPVAPIVVYKVSHGLYFLSI